MKEDDLCFFKKLVETIQMSDGNNLLTKKHTIILCRSANWMNIYKLTDWRGERKHKFTQADHIFGDVMVGLISLVLLL